MLQVLGMKQGHSSSMIRHYKRQLFVNALSFSLIQFRCVCLLSKAARLKGSFF